LRDVLYFQNGYCTPKIGIKLDNRGLDAEKKFDISYGKDAEIVGVDKFFDGYKLSEDTATKLLPQIGSKNFNILMTGDLIDKKINDVKDTNIEWPKEKLNDLKHKYDKQMVNQHYVMKENFKTVLLNLGIEGHEEKTKENVIDLITENSKNYINKEYIDIWMKNADIADISKGNDLPDIDIARKVMLERLEENKRCENIKPKALI
jgi:hypothetical protein